MFLQHLDGMMNDINTNMSPFVSDTVYIKDKSVKPNMSKKKSVAINSGHLTMSENSRHVFHNFVSSPSYFNCGKSIFIGTHFPIQS